VSVRLEPVQTSAAREQVVAATFALIVVGSLIVDATHSWFWQRSHDVAPVAAVLLLVFLEALLRGHRWAWRVFLIIGVAGLVTCAIDGTNELTVGAVVGSSSA
jgi:hypothetical protein